MPIVYLIAGVIGAAALTLIFLSHLRFMKMTSQTAGQVLRSENRVVRTETERREETVIICRYTVHGKEYEVERILRGRQAKRYPVGKQLTIRYNPAEPEMSDIAVG
ncbi:MAG: hypothetical protein JWP03_3097 [Phycisphaerales bacterium]|jgi:hypothetical protein|nr:hypothetical protein [Phycisphaerales bacterium]